MKIAMKLYLVLLLSVQAAAAQTAGQPAPPPGPHMDTVTVMGPREIEQAVHSFVKSYAKPSVLSGKLPRWTSNSPLCAQATGLDPVFDVFVAERIRTVAGMVGAAVETKAPCTPNMVVLFTPHPQALLDYVRNERTELLGHRYASQIRTSAQISHPVQAWYATATRDDKGVTRTDDAQALDQCVNSYGGDPTSLVRCGVSSRATRLIDGLRSEMSTVTVVVDSSRIVGMPLGAVADYVTMLALSQTESFETCQPMASIVNLMTSGCDAGLKPNELSLSDIAFLKAINRSNPDFVGTVQASDVARQMEDVLNGR